MVFKSMPDLLADSAPTWTFSLAADYANQGHPVHIP
jgi:hypothetical protein